MVRYIIGSLAGFEFACPLFEAVHIFDAKQVHGLKGMNGANFAITLGGEQYLVFDVGDAFGHSRDYENVILVKVPIKHTVHFAEHISTVPAGLFVDRVAMIRDFPDSQIHKSENGYDSKFEYMINTGKEIYPVLNLAALLNEKQRELVLDHDTLRTNRRKEEELKSKSSFRSEFSHISAKSKITEIWKKRELGA